MDRHLDPSVLTDSERWTVVYEQAVLGIEDGDGTFATDLVKWANETMVRAAPFEQVSTRPSLPYEEPQVVNGALAMRADRLMERLRRVVRRAYPLALRHREAERLRRSRR